MKIFYDGEIYSIYNRRPGGISNFFDHLISFVSQDYPCLLSSRRPEYLPHPTGRLLNISRCKFESRLSCLNSFVSNQLFSLASTCFRPDLIHCTFYNEPRIYTSRIPIIYTAYDMIAEKWPEDLDPSGKHVLLKKRCFDRAVAIPCISSSTRNDLLELYPYLEPKVSVIYLAGELKPVIVKDFQPCSTSKDAQFLLYVGARNSYKNFTRLLNAFACTVPQFPELLLKVVGPPFDDGELELIALLHLESKVIIYPDLDDSQLYQLYQYCTAFVYPSLYEGFGLPLLEAMASKAPIIASNASSIPEVVGSAALLFNPYSTDSIREAIIKIVSSPTLREDLRRRGILQSKQFTWERTCLQYVDLYRYVLDCSGTK